MKERNMYHKMLLIKMSFLALMMSQCKLRQQSDDNSKLSSIRIGDVSPTKPEIPIWSKLSLKLERTSPNPSTIDRDFARKVNAENADSSLTVPYGTYKMLLSYFDAKGTKIYESCPAEKTREHPVNMPTYNVEIKICLEGSGDQIGTVKPGNSDVVIKPVLEGDTAPKPGQLTGSIVERHGLLRVQGNKIVDKAGNPVQLRGMSLFWSHWSAQFWNKNVVASLKKDWKATLIRAAMGVEEGGYLTNQQLEKDRVKLIVEAAVEQGIYVIIDWHDHNANLHPDAAIAFFAEMAATYGNVPNVLFEIFNEPVNQSWDEVKAYSERVIRAIREKGAQNIIIVGTPTWSQRVDSAANNPINAANIAYTLHFYSATHKQDLRNIASYALSKGIALFVTEFGVCDASGNGALDLGEADLWMQFMDQHKISWANWSVNDKAETASALKPGSNPNGGWSDDNLTDSGKYIKRKIQEGQP